MEMGHWTLQPSNHTVAPGLRATRSPGVSRGDRFPAPNPALLTERLSGTGSNKRAYVFNWWQAYRRVTVCTLTIAWQAFAEYPILVAANRDELFERPSCPPERIESERGIIAPRDEEAGGTWIGYNEDGMVAAITNRWVDAELVGERSRGLLVRDVLDQPTAETACRIVERALDADAYEGFNLLMADQTAAILIEYDGGPQIHTLDPGVHVVMNVGFDTFHHVPSFRQAAGEQQVENGIRLFEYLQPDPGETATKWHTRARNALSDHEFGVCVHGDGFGTRSSSLIRIAPDGSGQYEFADGPPCRTAYEPVDEKSG